MLAAQLILEQNLPMAYTQVPLIITQVFKKKIGKKTC